MDDVTEIALSKDNLILPLIGTVIFVLLGLYFITESESIQTARHSATSIRTVGIAAVIFFGLVLIIIFKNLLFIFIKKLSGESIGLKIDRHGITDNSKPTGVGLIPWEDIKKIETSLINSQLIIITHTPAKYIDSAQNIALKLLMKANHKIHGSPLSINPNSLGIDREELRTLLRDEFQKRKRKLKKEKETRKLMVSER